MRGSVVEQKLKGKVALVTGSGRGLGNEYARHLAALGADVAIHDATREAPARFGEAADVGAVAERIAGEYGVRTAAVVGDIGSRAACGEIVAQTVAALGRLDILVNNAGGDIGADGNKPVPNDTLGIPEADVEAEIRRNLTGTIYMCQAAVPEMRKVGKGKIVTISSAAGVHPVTNGTIYGIAKAGVIHLTRCLAREVKGDNITVNCIAPGATITARFLATRPVDPDLVERTRKGEGLKRLGLPRDLARVVEFFVTDLSDFVSGEMLVVDGGGGPLI